MFEFLQRIRKGKNSSESSDEQNPPSDSSTATAPAKAAPAAKTDPVKEEPAPAKPKSRLASQLMGFAEEAPSTPPPADNAASRRPGATEDPLRRSYKQTASNPVKEVEPAEPEPYVDPTYLDNPARPVPERLQEVLWALGREIHEVRESVVAARDGLLMAHSKTNDERSEKQAAIVATTNGLGTLVTKAFERGEPIETTVLGEHGEIHIVLAGKHAILAICVRHGANTGQLNLEAKLASERIINILGA